MSEKTKLGEILVQAGLIDETQLEAAVSEQSRWGNRLGETLVQLGYVTEPELVRILSRHYGIPGVHLEGKQIEPDVLALLPVEVAEDYRCLPLFRKRVSGGELLYLGMAQPEDLRVVDDVSFRAGLPVRPVLVGPIQISSAIAAFYRGESSPKAEGEGSASALTETPISDGDTAPVFNDLQKAISEPLAPAELETQSEDGDVTVPELDEAAPPPPPATVDKPRDVPTREILHALTQLLIEKEIVGREELLERVALNRKRSAR